ncbi:carboxypeptidase-like regulatory domain-containing protein [Halosquirtibacter xylanolyticus]|uniref:carboxypeptidase-like regulatory domain-containing protein n=1 Tax=Halosquirtibacter xylanolyticus TaxID=3374599 RepID=UPI0037498567|nr:carboxypeptidase-like regulatory domain-containing protein [Prolixibacteraceae bacterium]
MQKIVSLFTIMVLSFSLYAQKSVILNGVILNAQTKESIPYANIGIDGTMTGTASNFDGEFQLKVPEKSIGNDIIVSAVGFHNIQIPWKNVKTGIILQIELKKQTFSIQEVDIQAQSLVLVRILRTAALNTQKHFIQTPYSLDAHYEYAFASKGQNHNHQANILYTDQKGYQLLNDSVLFKNYGYNLKNVTLDNPKNRDLDHRALYINDLLQFDLAKWKRGIFNPYTIKKFKLSKNNESKINGDIVWVVDYELLKPSFDITFDPYATEYKGKAYINMSDTTIIKNEVWVNASNFSPISANHYTKKTETATNRYYFATQYQKDGNKYLLESVQFTRQTEGDKAINTHANVYVTKTYKEAQSKSLKKYFYYWK